MSIQAVAFVRRLSLAVGVIAGGLGAVSGCIVAVQWCLATFGPTPVLVASGFAAGCVVTYATITSRTKSGSPSPPTTPE